MDPLRFLTATTPAPLPGLGGSATAAFTALPGLVSWVTLDPAFTGAAEGARITSVTPRAGAGGWALSNGSTGPVAMLRGQWMGAKFTFGFQETLVSPGFNPAQFGVALVVYSDGTTDNTKNRDAASIENAGSDKVIRRAAGGVWTAGGVPAAPLAAVPGYQMVIHDYDGTNASIRARDAQQTTPIANAAWSGVGRPAARLSLGGSLDSSSTGWHASIMEAWVFDSPILTSPARLAAIDDYFGRVYL